MSGSISASPCSFFPFSTFQLNIKTNVSSKLTITHPPHSSSNSYLKLKSHHAHRLPIPSSSSAGNFSNPRPVKCRSYNNNPGGDNGSKSVLDAFFLGKALAEAINERIESSVGELLSTVGRLQAEQQKQVQEFQEDVLERAKKAKEKAAREAQGKDITDKSTTTEGAEVVSSEVVTVDISPPSLRSQQINNSDPIIRMMMSDD